jgi:hypothetical protein
MVHHWEDRDKLKAHIGLAGTLSHLSFSLAVIFAVLGVIGDAANVKLGLTPCSWLLLAIVLSITSVSFVIGWATVWYLKIAA